MPCAVILTALPIEFLAVQAHLINLQEKTHPSGTVYEQGDFVTDGQRWRVGIVEVGAGNTGAALATQKAIDYFRPDILFFVGIAGGIKDVVIGDVVAATEVYGYESGKVGEKFFSRPKIGQSAYALVQRAKKEAEKTTWLERLLNIPDLKPHVFVAPIAAGEKVIASEKSDIFRFLREYYNDAIAVEMEGFGFLSAAFAHPEIKAIVIRGISDLIGGKDDDDLEPEDVRQKKASNHASAFAFEILAKYDFAQVSKLPISCEAQMIQTNSTPHNYQTKVERGGTAYIGTNYIYSPQNSNSRHLELQLTAISNELEKVSADFSEEIESKLDKIRELGCKGMLKSARDQIIEIKNRESWKIFAKPLQARILRMLAVYSINLDGDVDTANDFLEKSVQLDPEANISFVNALITSRDIGVEAALHELNEFSHINQINLKISLFLGSNQVDNALAVIQLIPEDIKFDANTYSLYALALLITGDVFNAHQKIEEAISINPEWQLVREIQALIDYHSALSPAALQKGRFPTPEPVNKIFVKHDKESLNRLQKAEDAFAKLVLETEDVEELRQNWRVWQRVRVTL
jgi:nucleoside phosphorylase